MERVGCDVLEEMVAAEKDIVLPLIEAAASWRVTGGVDDLKIEPASLEDVPLLHRDRIIYRIAEIFKEVRPTLHPFHCLFRHANLCIESVRLLAPHTALKIITGKFPQVVMVDIAGDSMPGGAADPAHQAEVVDMAMGDDDALNVIPAKAYFMELPLQSKQRTRELGGGVDEGYGTVPQNKHIGADESRESG
jgi:hypothetical protein